MFQGEIERLQSIGWENWKLNEKMMFIPPEMLVKKISFPAEAFEPNALNDETSGIWAETRASKILSVMMAKNIDFLWEVGAGNGYVAIPLERHNMGIIGIEPLEPGAQTLAAAGFASYLGTLEELALPDSSIKAIGLFDVLEHLEQPEKILQEIKRVLQPNGVLIITVPAHNFLFSDFDTSIGHFRRYSRKALTSTLEDSGFFLDSLEFFFHSLVIPALILRRLPYLLGRRKNFASIKNTNHRYLRFMQMVNKILKQIFKIENYFDLPFGLSILAVVHKSEV